MFIIFVLFVLVIARVEWVVGVGFGGCEVLGFRWVGCCCEFVCWVCGVLGLGVLVVLGFDLAFFLGLLGLFGCCLAFLGLVGLFCLGWLVLGWLFLGWLFWGGCFGFGLVGFLG